MPTAGFLTAPPHLRRHALAAGLAIAQAAAWAQQAPAATDGHAPASPAAAAPAAPAASLPMPAEATLPTVQVRAASDPDAYQPAQARVVKGAPALRDVPQSVTVVNRAVMDAQGAASLPDVLRNVPGITLGGAEGGQIGNNINLRGFTARTDLYLDGARDRGQYYRDVFFLDSVEVLKGPSSMLFGRGATGGVIDQVSKSPSLSAGGEVDVAADSHGTVRTSVDANHPLSATAAFRVEAMAQDVRFSRETLHNRDVGVAPSLKLGIGTPTEVTLSALLLRNDDMPDYGLPALDGRPAPVSHDNDYGLTDDHTTQRVGVGSVRIVHQLDAATTIRTQSQVAHVGTTAREVGASRVGTFVDGQFMTLPTSATGYGTPLPPRQLSVLLGSHDRTVDDNGFYNQADLTTTLATGAVTHTLLAGLDLSHDEYTNQAFTRANPAITGATGVAVVSLVDPVQQATPAGVVTSAGNLAQTHANGAGVYVNDTMQLGPRWKLVAGLRRDRYQAAATNAINSGNTPGNTTLASAQQTVAFTSVRAGAIWQPTDAQSWYVSYGTSFDPSLEALTVTTGQQALAPEKNHSVEAGFKLGLLHGDLSLDGAVFRIDKENARSQVSPGVYQLDGHVRVQGAEIGVAGRLTRTWQVIAGYTCLDGQVLAASALDGTDGKTLANTPHHSATLWTTWNATAEWEVGGGATAMSSRWASNTDVVAAPGYARLDATVAYHQPRWDLRLNLFNLTDRAYIASVQASDGGRSVPGTSRTAQLTGTWHF